MQTKAAASRFSGQHSSAVLRSSLIAGNFRGNNVANDIGGSGAISGSHSLVFASTATQPLPMDTVTGMEPQLWPLAFNGGRTRTHALKASSPAINLGSNPTAESDDHRGPGYLRTIGIQSDIGAFEFDPQFADRIFLDSFQTP